MEMEVKFLSRPELKDPVVICGLPGSGYVGKLGVEHLAKGLNAELFAVIYSSSFPPQVMIRADGSSELLKHEIHCWRNPEGGPAQHDLTVGDVRIRNVTTDIRGGMMGRQPDGNSIFIFDVAGLCIGHLGHLHHELDPGHLAMIGRLDIVLVPVDGGYTMAQKNMLEVLKALKARVVIPMHVKNEKCEFPIAPVDDFLRGRSNVKRLDSSEVELTKEELPSPTETVVLQPAN